MIEDKEYLQEMLVSEANVFHRRRMAQNKISHLTQKKAKVCPKTNDPAACNAKFDAKIQVTKDLLAKLNKSFSINIGIGGKK